MATISKNGGRCGVGRADNNNKRIDKGWIGKGRERERERERYHDRNRKSKPTKNFFASKNLY